MLWEMHLLFLSSGYSVKMEEMGYSETSVSFYQARLRHTPEDSMTCSVRRWSCPRAGNTGIWGHGSTAPLILNLGTRWRRVVSFMQQSLYPWRKNPQHPQNRRLCGPQSQSGRFVEDKNSLAPAGNRSPNHPARSLITIPTELSQFPFWYANRLITIASYFHSLVHWLLGTVKPHHSTSSRWF